MMGVCVCVCVRSTMDGRPRLSGKKGETRVTTIGERVGLLLPKSTTLVLSVQVLAQFPPSPASKFTALYTANNAIEETTTTSEL